MLKNDLDGNEAGCGHLRHYVPIRLPCWNLPLTFTVFVAPDSKGMFSASCRELPRIVVSGESEEETLAKAEATIRKALEAPPSTPDFPS